MEETIKIVAVLGSGDMGHGIAALALANGYEVHLRDIEQRFLDRAVGKMAAILEKVERKGKLTAEEREDAMNRRLHLYTDLESAVRDADLVVEAIPENLELKVSTFHQLDELTRPDTLLLSNSSTMSITAMAEATRHPERVAGLHFFNPPFLMKLVEIVRTKYTADSVVETLKAFCSGMGKKTVVAQKDTPGYIANRIGASSYAYFSVMIDEKGVTPEEIDAAMKKAGMPMGTCLLLDYVGLDLCIPTQEYYASHFGPDYRAPETIRKLVEAGNYGKKTGRGFYDWSDGMPSIDVEKDTGRYDSGVVTLLQANEAGKLVDDGVCTFAEADIAMKYGYNYPKGPVEAIADWDPKQLSARLTALSKKFNKEIFLPAKSIQNGSYQKTDKHI